jgi:hypothetical protein
MCEHSSVVWNRVAERVDAELKRAAAKLIPTLEHKIGTKALNDIAPARIRLQNGRQTKVHYDRGKPPWIEFVRKCDCLLVCLDDPVCFRILECERVC